MDWENKKELFGYINIQKYNKFTEELEDKVGDMCCASTK